MLDWVFKLRNQDKMDGMIKRELLAALGGVWLQQSRNWSLFSILELPFDGPMFPLKLIGRETFGR
jgi:hypothetical protein